MARPLPFTFPSLTAADLQAMPTAAERRQRNQGMIARVRGDGGYLDGFSFVRPNAVSRQRVRPAPEPVFAPVFVDAPTFVDQRTEVLNFYDIQERTEVVNRFEAPVAVTVGNGNVVAPEPGMVGPAAATSRAGPRRRGGGALSAAPRSPHVTLATPMARGDARSRAGRCHAPLISADRGTSAQRRIGSLSPSDFYRVPSAPCSSS